MSNKYDIVGIGNAVVDLFYFVDNKFIKDLGVKKNQMCVIDTETLHKISELNCKKTIAGGAVANSVRILSLLGVKSSFIGKLVNDKYGRLYMKNMEEYGIDFCCNIKPLNEKVNYTTTVSILVTRDAQRTMCTHRGASAFVAEEDIDDEVIKQSKFLYFGGYIWDDKECIENLYKTIILSRKNGNKVIMNPSSSYCISRFRGDFLELIHNYLDVFICNEDELMTLMQEKSFSIALSKIEKLLIKVPSLIFAITREEKDVIILHKGKSIKVPTEDIDREHLLDTTGAGDSFSAGFIYGLINDYDLEKCGRLGNFIASIIIQKVGAKFDYEEIDKIKHRIEKLGD
ncbi:adenosine kinase [Pseudomonadota bacterium]